MQTESYKSKSGETLHRPILESYDEVEAGFCLSCGVEVHGVEPDARRYRCEGCGLSKVYGIEELLLMGIAKVTAAVD